MKILESITLAIVLSITSLSAHSLWVNSFESFVHKPGHTTVGLGWGHTLPIDDNLNSPNGKVVVEEFFITNPKGKTTNLRIPSNKEAKALEETNSYDIYNSDVGLHKVAFKKDSPKGMYKIKAKSKATYYTVFLDKKDRKRFKLKSIDKLKGIKKVLIAIKYQAFANSYLTLGDKWENPKATNQGLEIIPKTDLSNLKVGDLVEFEVLFYGKPLHSSPKADAYITASSSSFGQSDHFSLHSNIKNGKAQFRVQSSGQWKVECKSKEKVTKGGKHKSLYGKTNTLINASTLTFNVK